jgi:hypothetical protein
MVIGMDSTPINLLPGDRVFLINTDYSKKPHAIDGAVTLVERVRDLDPEAAWTEPQEWRVRFQEPPDYTSIRHVHPAFLWGLHCLLNPGDPWMGRLWVGMAKSHLSV